MNLYAQGLLDAPIGWFAAAVIGLLFGFWLERAGFGSSRKLTAIFYAQDFAVLKVMFSAMATAALVLHGLAWRGLVDLSSFYVPETVLWAQLVGGAIFGAGFLIGGFCPGTAMVGLGSGRLDALAFLIGAGGGSLAFALAAPALAGLRTAGARGTCSVADLVGMPPVLGALALLAVALGAFALAGFVERKLVRKVEGA